MENTGAVHLASFITILGAIIFMAPGIIFAHCDTMDGPVIKAAQAALDSGKIEPVLVWIKRDDEPQLKAAFQKALAVRKLNDSARELADMYFFETLVRIHRAGEGAPFTGIKPAGSGLEPGVELADRALETGSPEELLKHLQHTIVHGAREHYERTLALKGKAGASVEAGRKYVESYVTYVHYIEKLFADALAKGGHHEGMPAGGGGHRH